MTLNYNLLGNLRTALLHYVINWRKKAKSESIVVQCCYTLQLLNPPQERRNNKVGVKLHVRHKSPVFSAFFSPWTANRKKVLPLCRDKVSLVWVCVPVEHEPTRRRQTPSQSGESLTQAHLDRKDIELQAVIINMLEKFLRSSSNETSLQAAYSLIDFPAFLSCGFNLIEL